MKKLLFFLLAVFHFLSFSTAGQDTVAAPRFMVSVYEDNDCLNLLSYRSDDAYSNGTRVAIFYTKCHASHFFLDRLMPKAGKNSEDVFGFSLMQVTYTPKDLFLSEFQNDYVYSGALFATHSLYSSNKVKKYSFRSELLAGVMGPASLAEETQSTIHKVMQFIPPAGWQNQFKNDVLLNVSFAAEKELWNYHNKVEIIGGGQLNVGTMADDAGVSSTVRLGIMNPYFSGLMTRYTSGDRHKTLKYKQLYLFAKPGIQYVARNSLIQGGMFSKLPVAAIWPFETTIQEPVPQIVHIVASVAYGFVFSYQRFGFSYSETSSTPALMGLYSHSYSNVSVYYYL